MPHEKRQKPLEKLTPILEEDFSQYIVRTMFSEYPDLKKISNPLKLNSLKILLQSFLKKEKWLPLYYENLEFTAYENEGDGIIVHLQGAYEVEVAEFLRDQLYKIFKKCGDCGDTVFGKYNFITITEGALLTLRLENAKKCQEAPIIRPCNNSKYATFQPLNISSITEETDAKVYPTCANGM